jgi:hypothetical protein
MMALKSCEMDPEYIPLYDYLDDLEAFFWVLVYLILSFKPNGDRMPRKGFQERTLRGWSQLGSDIAHDFKGSFLISQIDIYVMRKTMDPGWQVIYDEFFLGFRAFIREITDEKQLLLYTSRTELPDGTFAPSRFEPILARIDDHYNRVLALFDDALKKIVEISTSKAVPVPSNPPVQTASTPTSLSSPSLAHSSLSASTTHQVTAIEGAVLAEKRAISRSDTTTPPVPVSSSPPNLSESLARPLALSSRPKRRSEQAEFDDESPREAKRKCPPSRRQSRGILDSVYQFCRTLFE